jgi:16S rRNA processing protein RimM
MPTFSDLVVIGRFVRPQGRRGEVLTEPLSDRPERFTTLTKVFVETGDGGCREAMVSSTWPHKGRYVLKLDGVDSIDAAEQFRGRRLALREQDLPPLAEGTYYHHDLRGLRVEDESGAPLGTVVDLSETGAAPVLVVQGPAGERLVPFAEPFIRAVNIAEGRLVVSLLESFDAGD